MSILSFRSVEYSRVLRVFAAYGFVAATCIPGVALAQPFTRVDVAPDGSPANRPSRAPTISADGRFVAFLSEATNLVSPSPPSGGHGYIRDLQTGVTTLVDAPSPGGLFTLDVNAIGISSNGRFVVFNTSSALVPQDTNRCQIGVPPEVTTIGCYDVYVVDVQTHQLSLESVSSSGVVGDRDTFGTSISADGRFVVMESTSATLAPGDPQRSTVFLRDRLNGTTTRIGVQPTGVANGGLTNGIISADASTIAFFTTWTQADTGDNPCTRAGLTRCSVASVLDRSTGLIQMLDAIPPTPDVVQFVISGVSADGRVIALERDNTASNVRTPPVLYDRAIPRVTPLGDGSEFGVRMRADGRIAFVRSISAAQLYDDRLHSFLDPGLSSQTVFGMGDAVLSGDGLHLAFQGSNDPVTGVFSQNAGIFVQNLDLDHDGMLDAWERRFGLDPANPNDAAADPDGDGQTNLQEYLAGTDPIGKFSRYLAEGSNNPVFSTRLAVLNPQATPATVMLRFQNPTGANPLQLLRTIDAHRRATFDATTEPSLAGYGDFSTVLESDVPIVADRTMSVHDIGHGSHAETSIAQPGTTWYFAEGATGGPFSLFYELQNPTDTAATVTVRYLLPAPQPPLVKTYAVAAQSRRTIFVDEEDPLLGSTDVSAKITSDQPIIAERSMYLASLGQPFGAAEAGAAVPAPQAKWFLAEGATGAFFDLYVLIANAESSDAAVKLTYLLPDGTNFSKNYTVAKESRQTLLIDDEDPRLKDTPVSIIAESTNGVPIIVERAMWWPDGNWYEGHLSAGATTTATKWALAEGEVTPGESETYILIANTSSRDGQATVTLWFESGDPIQVTVPLPANSRTNVAASTMLPVSTNTTRRFGATIESDGVDLVVERSMYANVDGVTWASGTCALGTPLP